MFVCFDKMMLLSASSEDITTIYQWLSNKNYFASFENINNSISIKSVENIVRLNKTRLSQIVVIYIDNKKIGLAAYEFTNDICLLDIDIYEEKYTLHKIERDVLYHLMDFILKDDDISNAYQIKKFKANVRLNDAYMINEYLYRGFIKEEIKMNTYKNKNNEIFDSVDLALYVSNKFNPSILEQYDILLFDVDNTILDFDKAERHSLSSALKDIGYQPSEEDLKLYSKVNLKYWEMVERKECSVAECCVNRYKEYFELLHIDYDNVAFENLYRSYLNKSAYVIKNAREVLEVLSKKFDIYYITNGLAKTNSGRIKKAKFDIYCKEMIISETAKANKPSVGFYDYMVSRIPNFNNKKAIIIGDSLTSDMQFGNNFDIDTIWYNRKNSVNNKKVKPTYQINDILELIGK